MSRNWMLVLMVGCSVVLGVVLWIVMGSPAWLVRFLGSAAVAAAVLLGVWRADR